MPRAGRGALVLAEEHPPRRGRGIGRIVTLVLVVVAAVGGWYGIRHVKAALTGPSCQATAVGTTFAWATDQASNAAVITAISQKRGLPPRAASIALATAMQESKVRNVRFGDRDSLGLFQQRPSQGWGTPEQILNPEYSTNKFYDALVKVKGYTELPIHVAAQEVQRSADGSAYAQHEPQARITASALSGETPAGFACSLAEPTKAFSGAEVAALIKADHGLPGDRGRVSVDGSTLSVSGTTERDAWSVGAWAVARAVDTGALRVQVGSLVWQRALGDEALRWGPADEPIGATQVRIELPAP